LIHIFKELDNNILSESIIDKIRLKIFHNENVSNKKNKVNDNANANTNANDTIKENKYNSSRDTEINIFSFYNNDSKLKLSDHESKRSESRTKKVNTKLNTEINIYEESNKKIDYKVTDEDHYTDINNKNHKLNHDNKDKNLKRGCYGEEVFRKTIRSITF